MVYFLLRISPYHGININLYGLPSGYWWWTIIIEIKKNMFPKCQGDTWYKWTYIFFWPLYFLSFDWRILITLLYLQTLSFNKINLVSYRTLINGKDILNNWYNFHWMASMFTRALDKSKFYHVDVTDSIEGRQIGC